MVRLERHRLGPRVYVLGLRIHEVGLGLLVLAVLLAGGLAEAWEVTRPVTAVAALGSWLVVKDWRDLFPATRNTSAWGLGLHQVERR